MRRSKIFPDFPQNRRFWRIAFGRPKSNRCGAVRFFPDFPQNRLIWGLVVGRPKSNFHGPIWDRNPSQDSEGVSPAFVNLLLSPRRGAISVRRLRRGVNSGGKSRSPAPIAAMAPRDVVRNENPEGLGRIGIGRLLRQWAIWRSSPPYKRRPSMGLVPSSDRQGAQCLRAGHPPIRPTTGRGRGKHRRNAASRNSPMSHAYGFKLRPQWHPFVSMCSIPSIC